MKNKKIVINIDVKNKRVRKGFVQSDVKKNNKNINENKNKNKENDSKNINSKTNQEENLIENKTLNTSNYNQEYFEKYESQENEKNVKNVESEKTKIEYIKKSELDKISKGISIVNKHKKKDEIEREKRIGKTLKEVEEEKRERNNTNDFINLRPVFFSIFLIFIIIVLYIIFEYGPILGISLNINDVISETKIDIVSTEMDFYHEYDNELLVYSNQVLTTYNKNGKKTWSYTLDQMFTPSIYIEGSYMVVANNTSGNIYMFDKKKEILNMKIEGNISNVYIDENGYLAIEHSSSGYKKIIGIYDKSGKNIYNTYLENDTIADIKLLENARKILVTKINSTSFKSGVELILVDSTKQEENIKQIVKLDNNFVYDLIIQGQNIIMLLDNKLVSINIDTGEKNTIKSFESSQILYFTLSKNYYTCIEKELNSQNDEYIINNMRFDGTVISSLKILNSPKLVTTSGLLSYFIYQDGYSVVNKWGIEVANKKLATIPKDIIVFNNEKSVALIYTNIVYIKNL